MFLLLAALLQAPPASLHAVRDSSFEAPDLGLSWLWGVKVDRQHRVYVPDNAATILYRLSSDGRASERLVRPGAGPGEARTLQSLSWLGDTLVILDNRLQRLTFLGPDGKLIRTERLADRCVGQNPVALLRNGSCVEQMWPSNRQGPRDAPRPNWLVVGRKGAATVDTILRWSMENSSMQFERPNSMMMLGQPFTDMALQGTTSSGNAVIVVERPIAGNGKSDSALVRRWEPGRGWTRKAAIRYTPKPLSTRQVDSALTVMVARWGPPRPNDPFALTVDSLRAKVFRPPYFPPLEGAPQGMDGTIWLRMQASGNFTNAPGMASWLVLDSTFAMKRVVQVPAELRISTADGDLIWGVETSEDDVPVVARYRVVVQ